MKPTVKLQRAVLIGFIPFLATVGIFIVLNLVPDHEEMDIDWNAKFTLAQAKQSYGYPDPYRSRTTFLANPEKIFGDGGTLRNPRFAPPSWRTEDEFDADKLCWNIYWCGLYSLFVWLVSTTVHLSFHDRWNSWWRV